MKLYSLLCLGLGLLLPQGSHAQSSSGNNNSNNSSASASSSNNSSSLQPSATPFNSSLQVVTTTLTSMITPSPSASGSQSMSAYPSTLVLTLTINSTTFSDGTTTNNTVENGNGTLANATEPWKEGDNYIPFGIKIDPAYGILGALLIISGIPVAMLGGKMRWSSLAIASGYSIMLFTLVLILRFGVEPQMQPPSPQYASTTLRGLYLLACIIASLIGAAIGIFFFNFSKYWVSAAGGFTFGWFLMAVRDGGLIQSTVGRWGFLGGLTVGAFLSSLVPVLHDHLMLISTAWIGATAVTLGIDCYTRAGLKEFYIYNLGYRGLFPKLNGAKYPLTQTMMIELGILAAIVLVGAALQFKLLNMLTKRIKHHREEEEARVEAEEVAKAAEHFKNVGSELNEWEEKHGRGSGNKSPNSGFDSGHGGQTASLHENDLLPALGFTERDRPGRTSSTASLLHRQERYEPLSVHSPTTIGESPTTLNFTGHEEMLSAEHGISPSSRMPVDSELESKIKLLEEVKRARESVHSTLEKIRAGTPTPSLSQGLPSPTPSGAFNQARPTSSIYLADGSRSRRGSTTSSRMLDTVDKSQVTSQSDWDAYVRDRTVIAPPPAQSPVQPASAPMVDRSSNRGSQYAVVSDSVAKALDRRSRTTSMMDVQDRRDRTTSMMDLQPTDDWGPREMLEASPAHTSMGRRALSFHEMSNAAPQLTPRAQDRTSVSMGQRYVTGSAAGPRGPHHSASMSQSRSTPQRTMTYEELAERHRRRISALQEPVTARIKEPMDVASAKANWEAQKRHEREEMRRREAEKLAQARDRERKGPAPDKREVLRSTDDWRRSIHGGLDGFAVPQLPAPAAAARPDISGQGKKRASYVQRPGSHYAN